MNQKNASLKDKMAQANAKPDAGNAPARQTFETMVLSRRDKFADIMPKTMDVDRFIRTVIRLNQSTPAIKECEPNSVIAACALSAQLGLELGPLGHAYIVPFRDKGVPKAQFIIGYKGYINLARRSGEIEKIVPGTIGEKDHYDYKKIKPETLDTYLEHDVAKDGDSGKSIAFYVITHYKDGSKQVEFMYRSAIERYRKRSKSPNSPAWNDDYEAMAIKTVCRRASTFWPLTIEAETAIKADDSVSDELVIDMAEAAAAANEADYIDVEGEEVETEQVVDEHETVNEQ